MTDTTIGQTLEGQGTEPASMPNANQPTDESSLEQASTPEQQLPDGVSERTKQEFDKLKAHNKELAEKLALKEQSAQPQTSVLEDLNPTIPLVDTALPQSQVENIAAGLVDKDGYLDVELLNKKLKEADDKVRQASDIAKRTEAKVSQFEQSQQLTSTYAVYPQLKPGTKEFNPTFYNLVKNELIDQMMKNGQTDLMAASQKIATLLSSVKSEEPVSNEAVTQRTQASTQSSASRAVPTDAEHERLIKGTLSGDRDAIYERLKRSGY